MESKNHPKHLERVTASLKKEKAVTIREQKRRHTQMERQLNLEETAKEERRRIMEEIKADQEKALTLHSLRFERKVTFGFDLCVLFFVLFFVLFCLFFCFVCFFVFVLFLFLFLFSLSSIIVTQLIDYLPIFPFRLTKPSNKRFNSLARCKQNKRKN